MKALKKTKPYTEVEMNQLMCVREMWRAAKRGDKVCVVSSFMVTWDQVLGNYKDVVYPYVKSGDIYLKVEDETGGKYELEAGDLDNVIVEVRDAMCPTI